MKLKSITELQPTRTYLVAGQHGRGKTHVLLELASKSEQVHWVSTSNLRGITDEHTNLLIGIPENWNDFTAFTDELSKGRVDTIVIDTLNGLHQLGLFHYRNNRGTKGDLHQRDYLLLAEDLVHHVKRLSRYCHNLYVSIDVVKTKTGSLAIDVNRDLYNKLLAIFDNRWVCYTKMDKKTKRSIYAVVKEASEMSKFSPSN